MTAKKVRSPSANRLPSHIRRRRELISTIAKSRRSQVITYITSSRQGCGGQLAEDAVLPMHDHLRRIGKCQKLDLFLFTQGGFIEIPWRIVSMIREHCDEFSVIVPYKAMSAGTLIAIGADTIVMGKKAELGPIDPQLSLTRGPDSESISVEDIMSYITFLREKAGLTDQAALAKPLERLTSDYGPGLIGKINRVHSHIRSVARKMLTSRSEGNALDEQKIQVIVETLAEKTQQHGHAINRHEAREIGLQIQFPKMTLENLIWRLYEEYEKLCRMRDSIQLETCIPDGDEVAEEGVVVGAIESNKASHLCEGTHRATRKRELPQQLNMNLNFSISGVDPRKLPQNAKDIFDQIMAAIQNQAPALVQQEVQKHMPTVGVERQIRDLEWKKYD